jgi:hypothetical protein
MRAMSFFFYWISFFLSGITRLSAIQLFVVALAHEYAPCLI